MKQPPKRTEDKYWKGTRDFDHLQYEEDLEDYISDIIEEQMQAKNIVVKPDVRGQLIAFHKWQQKMWTNPNAEITENVVDTYLKAINLP